MRQLRRGRARQISIIIDEEIFQKLIKTKSETALPMSRQVELILKGYFLKKNEPSLYG